MLLLTVSGGRSGALDITVRLPNTLPVRSSLILTIWHFMPAQRKFLFMPKAWGGGASLTGPVGQAVLQSKTAQSGPRSRAAVERVSEAPQERNEERRLCRPEWNRRRNAAAPLMLFPLLFTSWSVSERCEAENIHIWAFSIFRQSFFWRVFIFPTFPWWKNKSGNARKWTYFFIYFSMVIRQFAAHGKINKSHSQVVCR